MQQQRHLVREITDLLLHGRSITFRYQYLKVKRKKMKMDYLNPYERDHSHIF